MLPRTDLIISYKPLPHVARSAIKHYFCTRESREIIVRGKLEPRSRKFLLISDFTQNCKNKERKIESS